MCSHLMAPLALALVLPPLPDMSSLPAEMANFVIPGRLKSGIDISNADDCAPLEAPADPTLQALRAICQLAEPRVRAGDEILYVYGGGGSAELVAACMMAELYQLSADEALARVSAYAALRDGEQAALTDAQKQLCRDVVRIRRASDCADE